MENNIFEGAKFGDKFVTRGGYMAIYTRHIHRHSLYSEKGWLECDDSGKYVGMYECTDADVVSRYQEPSSPCKVDEEELDRFADEHFDTYKMKYDGVSREEHNVAYKAGYRRAMEDKLWK